MISCAIYLILYYYFVKIQNKLINELVSKEFPEFKYITHKTITRKDIDSSNLFLNKKEKRSNSILVCNGIIKGKIGNVNMRFGDISLEIYKVRSKKIRFIKSMLFFVPFMPLIIIFLKLGKSFIQKNKSIAEPYNFKGLFFIADFNKNIKGCTIVLPDFLEKKIGIFAKMLQELNFSKENLVYMEDINFEKEFVVYSTDQIEARYVLSTSLMGKITELKKRIKKPLFFSFKGKKMYMGIADSNGFLSLRKSFKTSLNDDLIKIYDNIKFCTDVVKALNLNRQIWE
jgi:hypothetical protein